MKKILVLLGLLPCLYMISCSGSRQEKENEKKDLEELHSKTLALGDEIAMASQMALGSKLKQAIEENGIPQALKFCNANASPIVDSLKIQYHAEIKRATLQARNPADRATDFEEKEILAYQAKIAAGETPVPRVHEEGEFMVFTKPIILNAPLCLNCHGEVGKEVSEQNYKIIKALYPDDNATGHAIGDLRGIWTIKIPKEMI